MPSSRTESLLGMQWKASLDGWTTPRDFPHLLNAVDASCEIEGPAPTPAQCKALENFLARESDICTAALEAILRYVKFVRKEDPDLFEDIPRVKSIDQLAEVIEFQTLSVLTREHDGEGLVGLSFSCDWDPEHGLGLALYRGVVIDIGDATTSFQPDGSAAPDRVLDVGQKVAQSAVFGDALKKRKSKAERELEARLQAQTERMKQVLSDEQWGPAVKQLVQTIIAHPGQRAAVLLDLPDVPTPAANVTVDNAAMLSQLLGGLAGLLQFGNLNQPAPVAATPASPARPAVEINFGLGDDFAIWKYVGHVRNEQIEGTWPELLLAIAQKWPQGKLDADAVEIYVYDKKYNKIPSPESPLRGALIAAMAEVVGAKPS